MDEWNYEYTVGGINMDIEEVVKIVNQADPNDTRSIDYDVIRVFIDYIGEMTKEIDDPVINDVGLVIDKLDIPVWFAFTFGAYWITR